MSVDEDAYEHSIVIVLDCSGSMASDVKRKDWTDKSPCRYHRATTALREVLKSLPDRTRLTVLAFGHLKEGEREDDRRLWTRREPIRKQTRWKRGDDRQLRDLMDELESFYPYGSSPIVPATIEAQTKYLADVAGPKTILVLTDGQDNELDDNGNTKATDPAKTADRLTTIFGESKTAVNVVFFEVSDEENGKKTWERTTAEKQFRAIANFPMPGQMLFVDPIKNERDKIDDKQTSAALARTIEEALRPRYWVQDIGGNFVVPAGTDSKDKKKGNLTTYFREPGLRWFKGLDPKAYKVVLPDGTAKDILLSPGDKLMTTLRVKNDQVVFERELLTDFLKAGKATLPADPVSLDPWRVALIQNQQQRPSGRKAYLQMTAVVEDEKNRSAEPGRSLVVAKPQFTWLEVINQADDKNRLRTEWGNVFGYTAPAWTIDVPDWYASNDKMAKPMLRAWILDNEAHIAKAFFQRSPDVMLEDDFRKPARVRDDDVQIESVRYEDKEVEVRPGKRTKDCVVIRLRQAKGKKVLVRLRGVSATEAEHLYYDDAGKYTAIFWGMTRAQLNSPNFFIDLISIDDVKASAKPVDIRPDAPTDHGPPQL